MAIPIGFVHGAENRCFLPVSTEMTVKNLSERNGPELYERHVIPGYGHIDCIYGENAAADVYPYILAHLEKTATLPGATVEFKAIEQAPTTAAPGAPAPEPAGN